MFFNDCFQIVVDQLQNIFDEIMEVFLNEIIVMNLKRLFEGKEGRSNIS